MTVNEGRKYLKLMKPHYQKTSRSEQSDLLTEMEQVMGLHWKSLLRLLHAQALDRHKRQKGRGEIYSLAIEQVILTVWESLDYVCADQSFVLCPATLARRGVSGAKMSTFTSVLRDGRRSAHDGDALSRMSISTAVHR